MGDGTQIGFDKAKCRWELRPDLLLIHNAFDVLSTNERLFLAAMVSFYDPFEGSVFLKQVGVMGLADFGPLDLERRTIIASLLMNYHGW